MADTHVLHDVEPMYTKGMGAFLHVVNLCRVFALYGIIMRRVAERGWWSRGVRRMLNPVEDFNEGAHVSECLERMCDERREGAARMIHRQTRMVPEISAIVSSYLGAHEAIGLTLRGHVVSDGTRSRCRNPKRARLWK